MTSVIAIPYIGLTDTGFMIAPLTAGGALPAEVSLTVATAATAGATSIQLQASAAIVLKPGSVFSVAVVGGRVYVKTPETGADQNVTTTASAVTVMPLKAAIAANSVAPFRTGAVPIKGVDSFDLNPDSDVSEVTGTDTIGKIYACFRTGQQFQCTVHERPGDVGVSLIKNSIEGSSDRIKNRYLVAVRSDGEQVEGLVLISQGGRPGNKSTNAQMSFTASIQGDSYKRLDAYGLSTAA